MESMVHVDRGSTTVLGFLLYVLCARLYLDDRQPRCIGSVKSGLCQMAHTQLRRAELSPRLGQFAGPSRALDDIDTTSIQVLQFTMVFPKFTFLFQGIAHGEKASRHREPGRLRLVGPFYNLVPMPS